MFAILGRRTTIRESFLACALGALMALPQVACGGGGGAAASASTPTPTPAPASPVITSFTAAKSPILAGSSTTLTAVYANGTGSVDKGVGAIVSGTALAVTPTTDTTYTLTVTNAAGVTVTSTVSVAVTPIPSAPVITAPTFVTAGLGRYSASVPSQSGATYDWHLTNGTLTGGAGSPTITFAAGTSGTVDFSCVITGTNGVASAAGTASSTIVAVPVATSLIAAANPVPFRGTTTLTPTFSGGTGIVDGGVGTVTSGTPFTSAIITAAKTLTLTVTNAAGSSATTSVTLAAQTVTVGALSPSAPTRTAGTTTTFSGTATGGATNALQWSASAGSMIASTGVWTAPNTAQTATITATSVDDPSKSASTSVTVIPAATTPVITAPANVTAGQAGYIASVPAVAGFTYTWTISNGSITSATTGTTVTFTAGTTGAVGLGCTAINGAGTPSAQGTLSCAIVAAPVAVGLTATTNSVPYGGSTTITPTFLGGSGSVDQNIGTVTSGMGFSSGAIRGPKTFILTVTNALGATATTSLTLAPSPVSVGAVSPANGTKTIGTSTTFSATATGGATNAITWTASAGTMNAGTGQWSTPSSPQVVTITATSADDATQSATTTVTVVAAPSVPILTAPAFVGPGQGGYVATVPAQAAGTTYTWSINNGSITAGNGTRSITFFTGATGTVDLSCVATNAAGLPSVAGTFSTTISVAPLATALLPVTNPVPFGGSTMINPLFSGGNGVVDQSIGTVTNNTPFSSGVITAPKTFTLTVTNALNQTATTTVTLNPTPVSLSAISPANPTRTVSTSTIFSTTATGGVTNTINWTATAGVINPTTGAWIAPPSPATVTITATSVDDPTKSVTTTVSVVAAPVVSSLVASSINPAFGATFTLTPTYSGGIATIDQGVTCPGSGTASSPITANWTGARVYTLTVTNLAGAVASTTVTVTPKVVTLAAITPATPTRTVNSTTTFTASATNGATNGITWAASAGAIGAANGVWIAPSSVQTATITATSVDDPSKSVTTTVMVVPVPTTPNISAPAYVDPIQSGLTASVPAQAAGLIYTWAISNGSITAGNGTRSITFSTGASGSVGLTCTMSNAAGDAAPAATASCAIVAIPTISQISASPATVASGGAATLSYTFAGGPGVITPGNLTVISGGTTEVNPMATTTYTLTVTSPSGSTTRDTVTVTVINKPTIATFQAGPETITAGQGTLLTFAFTDDGSIDQGVGAVTSGGQVAVFPTVTTTYTLTANNAFSGTTTQTVTVTVKQFTGKFVYVANTGGGVSGFKLDDGTGVLTELDNSPFDTGTADGGTTPISALHVTSDPQGKFLFVVNGDGQTHLANTLTVFNIDPATGDLTKVAAYPTGTNPWASAVDPSGKFVYVRCAGSISAFSLDGSTGVLTPLATPSIATAAGTGEVLIHPSGQYLFTVGRTSDQLQVFNLDASTGALNPNSTYGLPAGTGPLSLALSYSGDYLFTKSEGAPSGPAADCTIYAYYLDLQTGGLTPLASTATGMQQADAFHGVSANPTQPVIYITLATSDNDYAAYALNLNTGVLSPLDATTYDLFGGTGSDSLVVSRNGKWGFMTNYSQHQIAVGAVNPSTGVLANPTFVPVGVSPVSVCVVGSVQ